MRVSARFAAMFLAVAALLMTAAMPAFAAPPIPDHAGQKTLYVALGDSYAYGLGADPATQSYPALLGAQPRVVLTANVTQPGATTSDVLTSQIPTARKELKKANLVTLTVGGNDLGVAAIAAVCTADPTSATPSAECLAAVAQAQAKLGSGELYQSILATINAVAEAAPKAQIVVTGYPLLFDPGFGLPLSPSLNALALQVNGATLALNSTIQAAVLASQAAGNNVVFVSVMELFFGHGLGGALDPWINSKGPGLFHPNANGYNLGYFTAITEILTTNQVLTSRAA